MTIPEILRNRTFWFIDLLKGNPVGKHLNEVRFLLKQGCSEKTVARKEKLLIDLLDHATGTTSFYKYLKGRQSLNEFPIINKNIIRESFNDFISASFKEKDLFEVVTSGSTGTPFKTYQNRNKRLRNNADTICFGEMAGFKVGHRLIYMKIWTKKKTRCKLHYKIQNILPVDVIKFNDIQIKKILAKMDKSCSTFGMIGYSSALELVCRYLDRNKPDKIKANVRSIITISETLNDYTKETLQRYFNTAAVSRYSNLENGIIAQQEPWGGQHFLINTASYCVEIVKMDSDEPVEEGERGRIVVTDLFNYAMPLIRYDTGDVGSFKKDLERPGCLFFEGIEGRKLDLLYDTKGNLVSSFIVYKNMWQYTEILQYQLIQEGKNKYVMKINVVGEFKRGKQLINELQTYLGQDAEIKVEYVKEIPLLDSGKRRKIVNNYIKL